MEEDRMPKKIFTQELEGTRRRGRPKKRWKEEVERDLQVLGVRRWRELMTDRKKMEGYSSTGQSPQRAVVPMEKRRRSNNYPICHKVKQPKIWCDTCSHIKQRPLLFGPSLNTINVWCRLMCYENKS
jgi:hypothetical protein